MLNYFCHYLRFWASALRKYCLHLMIVIHYRLILYIGAHLPSWQYAISQTIVAGKYCIVHYFSSHFTVLEASIFNHWLI